MLPLLLGVNNPQGNPPLWPDPPGCAGHRLWRLAHDACGIPLDAWMVVTQRVNLLGDRVLPPDYRGALRRRAGLLAPHYAARTVIFLGSDVANAFNHGLPPLQWAGERRWVLVPHPSGRNRWYNLTRHSYDAAALLASVVEPVWRELRDRASASTPEPLTLSSKEDRPLHALD